MKLVESLSRLFLLGGFAYLGLYMYGLVMGVFSPGEMLGFTALAAAFAIIGTIHGIRVRRAMRGRDRVRIAHELRRLHERRGF
jgi:hypothetical protein